MSDKGGNSKDDGDNRKKFVTVANIPNGQARGKRDKVTVPQCPACNRAHPNIDISEGISGGNYYNCPTTSGVVYVRIK